MSAGDEVLVSVEGRLGRLVLHRPRVLNALTLGMIQTISRALAQWRTSDEVDAVLLAGAGDRGFCAGGDIRMLRDAALGDHRAAQLFWTGEYRLNATIAGYPKPVVTLMDGFVMGGGVGVSAHAGHRVVTERSTVSMPEVAIGFAPDVGATRLFTTAPGELGTFAALTGARLGPADAIALGLADVLVPTARLAELVDRLRSEPPAGVLASLSVPAPGPAELAAARSWVDEVFAGDSVAAIRHRLTDRTEPLAQAARELLDAASPTALTVTLRALREARRHDSLAACLRQEYRTSCAFLDTPDFPEGVRAVLAKDRAPRWQPASLSEVRPADVTRYFTPRDGAELDLAGAGR